MARAIVRKYEFYPVIAWKIMFLDILDQLNEYDGENSDAEIDQDDDFMKK